MSESDFARLKQQLIREARNHYVVRHLQQLQYAAVIDLPLDALQGYVNKVVTRRGLMIDATKEFPRGAKLFARRDARQEFHASMAACYLSMVAVRKGREEFYPLLRSAFVSIA